MLEESLSKCIHHRLANLRVQKKITLKFQGLYLKVVSFLGPAQLSVTCSTDFSFTHRESL